MIRPILEERDTVSLLGKPGTGKGVKGQEIILQFPRGIIVECRPVGRGGSVGEYLGTPFWDFDAMVDHVAKNEEFTVRWMGSCQEENLGQLEHVFNLAYKKTKTAVLVAEAARFPFEGLFRDAIIWGRTPENISVIVDSQKPGMLHDELRDNMSEVYGFCTTSDSALRWFRPIFKDRTPELSGLKQFEYLKWEQRTAEITSGRAEII